MREDSMVFIPSVDNDFASECQAIHRMAISTLG